MRRPKWSPREQRTQNILRRSLAGGKFYGHPAAFAVYASASTRWKKWLRTGSERRCMWCGTSRVDLNGACGAYGSFSQPRRSRN